MWVQVHGKFDWENENEIRRMFEPVARKEGRHPNGMHVRTMHVRSVVRKCEDCSEEFSSDSE